MIEEGKVIVVLARFSFLLWSPLFFMFYFPLFKFPASLWVLTPIVLISDSTDLFAKAPKPNFANGSTQVLSSSSGNFIYFRFFYATAKYECLK